MTEPNVSYLSDDSSEDDDKDNFQFDFDTNRASLSEYETNRASLSDFESNRLSFTGSEHDTPFSDPESNKEFSEFNDNHQVQSESNSEEESRPFFQPSNSSSQTEKVTFHKYGQPTKVIHKPSSSTSGYSSQSVHSSKRSRSTDSEDQDDEPALRKTKYDELAKPAMAEPQKFDKAKAMMERMGYKEGRGLGKNAQGRVAPIEVSKQRGRRGLGLNVPGLEPANLTWDHSAEVVKVEEEPTWLVGDHLPSIPLNVLKSWKQNGPKNLNIEEYTDFCDPSVLSNIISKKSIFDSLEGEEMRRARTRSNPFETIGKGMFLNRAAMKMANMDKVFDFMFTSPKTQTGEPMVKKNELLYFADVCAGPGGFSEYVLWRKKWRAKGFGFTLRGENDFKLSDFFSGPCESFEPFYGIKEDGDVFDPANIESLMHFVMDNTQQIGVHFMMADGGFSVDGQENIQELLSKQLYLCQFLVALCIVRTGGHFVCKLFDVFSPFSVGLVYLMYRAFEKISIHKPNTSRPANSERYIICKWKREDCEPTRQYLFDLNKELCSLGSISKEDINYCVSMEELMQDRLFYDYIVESNNILGERQVVNLVKIAAFCRDMNLTEQRQADIRRQCLVYWDVPDIARKIDRTTADDLASKRVQKCGINSDLLTSKATELTTEEQLETVFKSIYDWYCVPIASHQDHNFFIGLGRNRVFRLTGQYWKRVEGNGLELSPGTMVYGELVREVGGENKSQVKKMAFHIIDAISLGDEDVTHLHYSERLKLCDLFAESLFKYTRKDLFRIKAKQRFPLEDINHLFQNLTIMKMKTNCLEMLLKTDQDEFAFQPKGVMFFKATKDPWMRHLSRSHNVCYYAKPGTPSLFDRDRPQDACASTMDCMSGRHVWLWKEGAGLHKEKAKEGVLHMELILRFLNHRLQRR